ncbi:MAG: class I SAM-dependent methyltransferase, partial [Steroidobacteraceae bacterium]
AAPGEDWRRRPDMDPEFTRPFRAAIVARSRFIEDLVLEQAARGIGQYVILGSGLDTFAQRRPEIASRMTVFEIDRPPHQSWKRGRLVELGFGLPGWLRLVSADFEAGQTWWSQLAAAGFDAAKPAVVACAGVSMYLTRDAIVATLRQAAALAPGTTLAMTFLLPLELMGPEARAGFQLAEKGARASGTPFVSFFAPSEILSLAREAGFKEARHICTADLTDRYFKGRSDDLRLSAGEEFLLAAV